MNLKLINRTVLQDIIALSTLQSINMQIERKLKVDSML